MYFKLRTEFQLGATRYQTLEAARGEASRLVGKTQIGNVDIIEIEGNIGSEGPKDSSGLKIVERWTTRGDIRKFDARWRLIGIRKAPASVRQRLKSPEDVSPTLQLSMDRLGITMGEYEDG